MAQPTLTVKGVDVTAYVTSWGTLEAVRKLRLSDDALFSSRFTVPLDNTQGYFTEGGSVSLFPKGAWAGSEAVLERDGLELYRGFVTDLRTDDEKQTVTLVMSASMTKAGDTDADLTGTGLNPAMACRSLLVLGGLGDFLDEGSFSVAAGALNGYPVDVTCPRSAGESCLSLASKIADVCSLGFIVVRGIVYCQVQKPWDGSGLRQTITDNIARSFGEMGHSTSNFANVVAFSWGGSGDVEVVRDEASIKAEAGIEVVTTANATSSAKVSITTAATAHFYGRLLLARVSPRRRTVDVVLGEDFPELLPGWSYPITYPALGLSATPFEVDEAQLDLDKDEWSVKFSTLEVSR